MRLTPVQSFGGWFAKREDLADFTDSASPSGSKVRQFNNMAAAYPGRPMLVGCSPDSAMQIYIAAAAKAAGVPAIVYVAARAQRTAATEYAANLGAEINEVRPGYLSVVRARAKARAVELGGSVRWNPEQAMRDTAAQTANIPPQVRCIIVPSGSGLTAAGVLAGLAIHGHKAEVVARAVSPMASAQDIIDKASKLVGSPLPSLTLVPPVCKYEKWKAAVLPDKTPLDPYYAAKVEISALHEGDCLWLTGLRPAAAMPAGCVAALKKLGANLGA